MLGSFKLRKMREYVVGKPSLAYLLEQGGIVGKVWLPAAMSGMSTAIFKPTIMEQKNLLLDSSYYYYGLEDWGKVFADVLMHLPKYSDRFDCDSFALLVAARVQEKYQVNGCGIAIGKSPWGYHAWNIFAAATTRRDSAFLYFETALLYLEPQNGMVYELDEDSGYKADYVIWG